MSVIDYTWQVVVLAGQVVFGQWVVQAFTVYLLGKLRLTDWFGYLMSAAVLALMPFRQWALWPPLVWFSVLAVVIGLVLAPRTLARWRSGELPTGIFIFGKTPEGVRNLLRRGEWAAS